MKKIFQAIGVERRWFLANGFPATEIEADAIAMGLLPGRSEMKESVIWSFGPTTECLAKRAFSSWASTSPVYHLNRFEEIRLL